MAGNYDALASNQHEKLNWIHKELMFKEINEHSEQHNWDISNSL